MKPTDITREEMWARQNLSAADIDYSIWERDKLMLHQMSSLTRAVPLWWMYISSDMPLPPLTLWTYWGMTAIR